MLENATRSARQPFCLLSERGAELAARQSLIGTLTRGRRVIVSAARVLHTNNPRAQPQGRAETEGGREALVAQVGLPKWF